jgi:hypothetical protein
MPKIPVGKSRRDNALDDEVERALYKKATGHHAVVERPMWNPKLGKHDVVKFKEYYPPDTVAARFWLMNRRPNSWQVEPQPGPPEDLPQRMFTLNIFDRDLTPKNELAGQKKRPDAQTGANISNTRDELPH